MHSGISLVTTETDCSAFSIGIVFCGGVTLRGDGRSWSLSTFPAAGAAVTVMVSSVEPPPVHRQTCRQPLWLLQPRFYAAGVWLSSFKTRHWYIL